MRKQLSKPSYKDVLREWNITIINPINTHICNSNIVNPKKEGNQGVNFQDLRSLKFQKSVLYLLRHHNNRFKVVIFIQTQKKGVLTRETGVTTNKD